MTLLPKNNMWRHWRRAAVRVAGLAVADLACFWVLRHTLRSVRTGLLVGDTFALSLSSVFPPGFVNGFEFAPALLLSAAFVGAYGAGEARRDPGRLVAASGLAALICLYSHLWSEGSLLVLFQIIALTTLFGATLSTARLILEVGVTRFRAVRFPVNVVTIQDGRDATSNPEMTGFFEFPAHGSKVVAKLDASKTPDVTGHLQKLIESRKADTVILAGNVSGDLFAKVMDVVLAHGCRLLATVRSERVAHIVPHRVWVSGIPMTELTAPALRFSQLAMKRALDLIVATISLLFLAPLMVALAIWIKLDSPGPILFRQRRLGLGGHDFECLKYRSMHRDAESILRSDPELHESYVTNGYKLPAELDPRLTRVGRLIRCRSLDELPQLFNVLKGELSLVGPRPIVPDELSEYGGGTHLFLSVKPGITGSWAISGRSRVHYPGRAVTELEYARNWNIRRDIRILLKTVRVVLSGAGAF